MNIAIIGFTLFLAVTVVPSVASTRRPDCHDTPITRVPSPDGSLVVHLYHRNCTEVSYTAAMMRTRPTAQLSEGAEVCHLTFLRGRLKIEAVWKDSGHVLISSPDRIGWWDFAVSSKEDSCNGIKISYDLNVEEAPPEESSDPRVEAAIRKAVEFAAPCLMDRHHPDHPKVFYGELDGGAHRSALSLLLSNLYDYRCPVSRQAYALMEMAGVALKIEREELEQLRPQVTTSSRATKIISDLRRQAAAARARIRRSPPDTGATAPQRLFGAWLDYRKVFIDATARLVIEPQVEGEMEEFSDGMAKISWPSEGPGKNTKYGYMDTRGRVVVPPQFETARNFHEGLAWVETRMWLDGPRGFIDKTGKIVIPLPKQANDPRFSEGLAAVSLGNGYGFIDKAGRTVIEAGFSSAGDFSEGLAWVHSQDGKAVVIDKTGKFVIGPADYELTDESNFSEGLAVVRINGKVGYIDRAGRVVIRPRFDDAHPFSGDRARVRVNEKYGYIDRSGRLVIRLRYDFAQDFSEGLAVVEVRRRGYGYIDNQGRMAIRPQYEGASEFMEGIAWVSTKERGMGYIDKKGTYVWGPFH